MLTKSVSSLEEREKGRNDLLEWINQQKSFVVTWKSKPLKLRVDANTTDLSNVQSIVNSIADKKEELLNAGPEDVQLSRELNSLNELVKKLALVFNVFCCS